MIPRDTFSGAASTAERIVREHNIPSLPIDPIGIANSVGIEVVAKPASDGGVSGLLIRYGEQLPTSWATTSWKVTSMQFSGKARCMNPGPALCRLSLTSVKLITSRRGYLCQTPYFSRRCDALARGWRR
jgi:hypothetical protein